MGMGLGAKRQQQSGRGLVTLRHLPKTTGGGQRSAVVTGWQAIEPDHLIVFLTFQERGADRTLPWLVTRHAVMGSSMWRLITACGLPRPKDERQAADFDLNDLVGRQARVDLRTVSGVVTGPPELAITAVWPIYRAVHPSGPDPRDDNRETQRLADEKLALEKKLGLRPLLEHDVAHLRQLVAAKESNASEAGSRGDELAAAGANGEAG